jgi:uncharacterized protein HemY
MASVGDTAGAKALVAGFSDADSEQVFAFVKIAEIQFKGGDTPGARQTIELANAATANVDEYLLSACLCAIAKAQVKMGDLAAAKALGKNNTEHLIREIAIAQAEMGDLEAARVSLTQISDADEKVCVEASIAEAQVKSGDTSSAGQTLDEAKWTAAKITESKEDACGRIAAAETKAGDAATAVEWARSQQDPMVKVSALVNIARALHSPSLADGW